MFFAGALAVWFVVLVGFSPPNRAWRGHFGRVFVRLPGVHRIYRACVSVGGPDTILFFVAWWGALLLVTWLAGVDPAWCYLIDAARRLDDYFNHDDDTFRRFFEGVRNRVKWKMELPPKPEPRAGTG